MSNLISLIYVSAASGKFGDSELMTLLKKARIKNEQLNITGLLLYNGKGTFMQLIEGPETAIHQLYTTISKDSRHHRINCISQKAFTERLFPSWQMGLQHITPQDHTAIPGISDFFHDDIDVNIKSIDDKTIRAIFTHFKSESSRVNTAS